MTRLPLCVLAGLVACGTDPFDPIVLDEVCDGFAATPVSWDLPEPFVYSFQMHGREGVGDYWSLFDLDGDGLLDLIQHHHGNNADAETMGANWYVWWNTGTGFGARTQYTLPVDHRELGGLYDANFIMAVLDITGDGVADLVRARDPEANDVWGADDGPHWRVHTGEGRTGFAVDPIEWTLPDAIDGHVHSSRTGGMQWTTFDIDADGVVELVQTASLEDAFTWGYAEDDPHWRVFRNTGDGFAARFEEWPLPPMPDGRNGWFTSHSNALPNQSQRTQDLTGDGLPDLIVPRDGAWPNDVWGADHAPHWRVYPNLGDAFASDWLEWTLPDETFAYPSQAEDWIIEVSQTWDTFVNGGGMPNLVVPGDGDWQVYRNQGTHFALEATPWSVPDPVFTALWADGGAVAEGWTTVDLDGDGCMDLVLTAGLDLGVPDAGTTAWTWHVWRGE